MTYYSFASYLLFKEVRKNIKIILTLFGLLISNGIFAQLCISNTNTTPCCNGIIRTDPRTAHTSNTERTGFENKFDWRAYGDYSVYHPDGGYDFGTGVPYDAWNPFYKNLSYLKHINNYPSVAQNQSEDYKIDFHPEDGWELAHRHLGYELDETTLVTNNTDNRTGPYFILYNRYTGMLRIIASLDNLAAHQSIETGIDFVDATGTGPNKDLVHSALFGHYGETTQTLDQKSGSKVAQLSSYPENKGWWVADFSMAYDPCVCNNESKIKINFSVLDSASVTMDGRVIGTSTPLDGSGSSPLLNGTDFLFAVKKEGFNDVKGGMQTYHNINTLVNKFQQQEASPGQKELLAALHLPEIMLRNHLKSVEHYN